MAEPKRKKLGEILIEQGVLSPDNLQKALDVQKKEGALLGEILVRLQMVTEEDIAVALATQFNYPYLPVANFTINPEAIKICPQEMVLKYTFIPIDKINNILTVVMSDPSNEDVVRSIEAATQCRVQAFVGTVTEIEDAIRRQYKVLSMEKGASDDQKVKMTLKVAAEENSRKEK